MTNARPKLVCAACRSRKKKCDGIQPTCSSCFKRNVVCSYDPVEIGQYPLVSTVRSGALFPGGLAMSGPAPFPYDWGLPGIAEPFYALSPPDDLGFTPLDISSSFPLTNDAFFGSSDSAANQNDQRFLWEGLDRRCLPISAPTGGPTSQTDDQMVSEPTTSLNHNTIIELTDLFFDHIQCFIPLFHRRSLRDSVVAQGTSPSCPLLLYSIMAVAAFAHSDPGIKASRPLWYAKAKEAYEATGHVPDRPLETLQAATCLVLHALAVGDHSDGLLILGKAWRQAVALGLHHMDSPARTLLHGTNLPDSRDWQEMEQRRRVVWALFILDRGMCFLAGFAHAIDDRQLRVRLPMNESIFQDKDKPQDSRDAIMYSQDPSALVASIQQNSTINPLHNLILSYSLLGRISEHMYSPEYDQHSAYQRSERETFEQTLTKMKLSLPGSAPDLPASTSSDIRHSIWLRIAMDVQTIFLHHTPQHDPSEDQDMQGQDSWDRCVATARYTALLVREASSVSVGFLINPLLAAPLFVCARVLVIEYFLSGHVEASPQPRRDPALRADLETMVRVLDRLQEAFPGAQKFRVGLFFHLRQDPIGMLAIKTEGSRGILRSCSKWTSFPDLDVLANIPP